MSLLYNYFKDSAISVLSLSLLHYLNYHKYKYKDHVSKVDKLLNAGVLLSSFFTCIYRTICLLICLRIPVKLRRYGLPRLFISPIIFVLGLITSCTHLLISKFIYLLFREEKDLFVPSTDNINYSTSNEIMLVKSKSPTNWFSTIFNGNKTPFSNNSDTNVKKKFFINYLISS